MQDERVKAFKNELKNYSYYKKKLDKVQTMLDCCYDMLPGSVHGMDPSKEPIHSAPNKEFEAKVRDDIEKYEKILNLTKAKIKALDEVLNKMDELPKSYVTDVLIKGKTVRNVAKKHYMTHPTLINAINNEIKKALDN